MKMEDDTARRTRLMEENERFLAQDVCERMEKCAEAFEAERQLRKQTGVIP